MGQDTTEEMTIGDLAEAVGVTVRTIRHYESIGLVEPADRSFGGHRRYGPADLDRLRQIIALRDCGFSLATISRLLGSSSREESLSLARRQLERSEIELDVARRLRARLRRFVALLEADEKSIDQLIAETEVEDMDEGDDSLASITTRLGDAGDSDLVDGTRVAKTAPVFAAMGTVEELEVQLGALLAEGDLPDPHRQVLERVANDLFDICSDLASPPQEGDRLRIDAGYVEALDRACEEIGSTVEPLDAFVLWFDTKVAANLNVCRATCRRAERVAFAVEDANPEIGRYLNRLSDLLFIISRANAGGEERLWQPGLSRSA
jgi:cob(I)alamin adenosyltransferase